MTKEKKKISRTADASRAKSEKVEEFSPAVSPLAEPDTGEPEDYEEVPVSGETASPKQGKNPISKPAAVVLSAVLIVCIIVLAYIVLQSMNAAVGAGDYQLNYGNYTSELPVPVAGMSKDECLTKNGIGISTVVFAYLPTCPYCKQMTPLVTGLGNKYSFKFVDMSDLKERQILYDCFGSVVSGNVPQFICPKTLRERTGILTENEIASFAEACKS